MWWRGPVMTRQRHKNSNKFCRQERNLSPASLSQHSPRYLLISDNMSVSGSRSSRSSGAGPPGSTSTPWSTCPPWEGVLPLTCPPPSPSLPAPGPGPPGLTTRPSLTSRCRRPWSQWPAWPRPTQSLPSWPVTGSPPRPQISTHLATPGRHPPPSQPSECFQHSLHWPTPPSPSPPPPSSPPRPPPTTPPPTPPEKTCPPHTARSLSWPPPSLATGWSTVWRPSVRQTPECRPPPPPPPPPSSHHTLGLTPGPRQPGSASWPGSASSSCCPAQTRRGRRLRSSAGRTRLQWRLTQGTPTDTLPMAWPLSRYVRNHLVDESR